MIFWFALCLHHFLRYFYFRIVYFCALAHAITYSLFNREPLNHSWIQFRFVLAVLHTLFHLSMLFTNLFFLIFSSCFYKHAKRKHRVALVKHRVSCAFRHINLSAIHWFWYLADDKLFWHIVENFSDANKTCGRC